MKAAIGIDYLDREFPTAQVGLQFVVAGQEYVVSGIDVYRVQGSTWTFVGSVSKAEAGSRHKIVEALGL